MSEKQRLQDELEEGTEEEKNNHGMTSKSHKSGLADDAGSDAKRDLLVGGCVGACCIICCYC
jgi:hypothetical protein